jgi:hypothetical protein
MNTITDFWVVVCLLVNKVLITEKVE